MDTIDELEKLETDIINKKQTTHLLSVLENEEAENSGNHNNRTESSEKQDQDHKDQLSDGLSPQRSPGERRDTFSFKIAEHSDNHLDQEMAARQRSLTDFMIPDFTTEQENVDASKENIDE